MDEMDILDRIERLEKAVFREKRYEEPDVKGDFLELINKIAVLMKPLRSDYRENDWIVLQSILPGDENRAYAHLTSFFTLCEEESDEDVAKLCGALASKQRISVIKHVAMESHSSGELVELTGMAGGHLHHHLRDLLSLGLIYKDSEGKYRATEFGINAYITTAALNRRLSYDNREAFRVNLDGLEPENSQGDM